MGAITKERTRYRIRPHPPTYLELSSRGELPPEWEAERQIIRIINRQGAPITLSGILDCVGLTDPEADREMYAGIVARLRKISILSFDPRFGYLKGPFWGIPTCSE